MSAVYDETAQFERALLDACALDASEWKRYAELHTRKAEMAHPDLRAESFKEAEDEKLRALKQRLPREAFAKYTRTLSNVLRKIGSRFSRARALILLSRLKRAMCKAPRLVLTER